MDEAELVKRFMEHRDVVLSYIFALTRDYDVAEEVFQNVAVSVLHEAGRETSVEHMPAWLRKIARHRVADYYRQHARRLAKERASGSMSDVISLAFEESAVSPGVSHERMKSLLECLQKLSGRSREAIDGFYRDRKSLKDLAAALGWQENSVKVALSRARKTLGDCIEMKLRAAQPG